MTNPTTVNAPNRFWIVRKPDASGAIVARFDTPEGAEVSIPDTCTAYSVADRATLEGTTVDESVLTTEEKQILGVPP